MYKYKNEHNRQQADDWLWDTIPNTSIPTKVRILLIFLSKAISHDYYMFMDYEQNKSSFLLTTKI